MKSNRTAAVAVVCLLFALSPTACCSAAPEPPPVVSSDGVEIQKVLAEVQKALQASADRLAGVPMPPLDSVTLTLQASAVRQIGGKISLFFISFGHTVQRETTQELVLKLTPPTGRKVTELAPPKTLADQLVEAIVGAAKGVQAAAAPEAKPRLDLKSLTLSVGFILEKDTSAGGSFTISPVTVNLGADLKDKAVQKLTLVFEKK